MSGYSVSNRLYFGPYKLVSYDILIKLGILLVPEISKNNLSLKLFPAGILSRSIILVGFSEHEWECICV